LVGYSIFDIGMILLITFHLYRFCERHCRSIFLAPAQKSTWGLEIRVEGEGIPKR
jgi:hypothetical protein